MQNKSHPRNPGFRSSIPVLATVGLICLFSASDAHAYLDGGTAAIVFQIVAATALGVLFYFKSLWWKVKRFFVRNPREEPGADD
ncbi:MAG: hypothetical protein AMXMBFR84_29900 [Candidatus Hydrogenedentota bacterium]